jgi:hypothetical protein
MHLLIILLQQLLGMLPGSKKVPQPEVVRKSSAPNAGEPDACGRIAPSLSGWMTPFESFLCCATGLRCATGPRLTPAAALWWVVGRPFEPAARLRLSIAGLPTAIPRARPYSLAAGERRPRR